VTTAAVLRFEARGFTTTQGRLVQRSEALEREIRRMFMTERRELQKVLREEAPKRTGVFARGLRTFFYEQGSGNYRVEAVSTGPHAWLLPLIVGGTKPHLIPRGGTAEMMTKGYPLRFYWERGPKGPGIYYFWHVHHPGTKPNPFINRALGRRWPHIRRNARMLGVSVASLSTYYPS